MLPVRTILHPTDFSEPSTSALRLACSLARDYGARLILLHVAPAPIVVPAMGVVPPQTEEEFQRTRAALRDLEIPVPGVEADRCLLQGDAAAEILRAAEENQCDVIVMGTHGRTGLGRLLMGSVAEQVLRKAPCPVVTVKNPIRQRPEPKENPGAAAAGASVRAPA